MAFAKLIAFDRPLASAALPGAGGRFCTEAELAAHGQEGYRRGIDAARSLADQQMVEFRADVEALGDGVFQKLSVLEPALVSQLRDALPALALDLAKRLLAGYEPSPEIVSRLCEEALMELFPERDNLELTISPRDAAFLEALKPDWLSRYPQLRMRTDAAMSAGDCQVRSRFGLTDARQKSKLAALAESLQPA
jgi:flagellar assembly protein FliH